MQLDPDGLLSDLDPAQRAAVTSPATPLAIIAPAGSGKTRVLTRRIAWRVATGDADPRHVLALTFTRKAAAELVTRLRQVGLRADVAAGTFHAVAFAQIRARWAERGWQPQTLVASKATVLGSMPQVRRARITVADLASEIEWAKARFVAADHYADEIAATGRKPPASAATIAELYAAYEEAKRARRLVDFDDLLRLCIDAIENDETFAATQRWRCRHLFVDEFQDVNPLQFRLLEAWRGGRYDLCVVGDPQQAIYGWNGADARFITDIRTYYPPAEVIVLDRNYRSTPQILSAASSVLAAARLDVHDVEATLGDGGTPLVERYDTDAEEALGVARAVRDLHAPGAPWSAQAVLVRTHNQTKLLLDALRSAGIPARVRGTASLLDRREVRKVVDAMRASNAPLATFLPDLEMPDAANDDGDDVGVDDDVRAALEQIAELGRDHLRLQPDAKASMFAAWLFASTSGDATDRNDAVDVATFHAAKGLEWPIVHLAGLEDGYVPVTHARSRPARAEEARLLYVAMTRAEQTLRCTWAGQRAFGAKILERQVSPFLRPLVDVGRQHAAQDPRQRAHADPEWRAHVAAQRAVLAAATQPQSPEHEALRRWRDDAARAARIDPESVLTERVLHAVASAHPSDVDALAAISGVGSLLAARFGDGILAALAGVSAR